VTDRQPAGATLDATVRTDIDNAVLCWLATVGRDGLPNVTPKEIFSSHGDDRIVVADIASANSVANIRATPGVCVSFIDVFRQRGFKIKGMATIVPPDSDDFADLGATLLRMAGDAFPIRHVIAVRVDRVERILAPSYHLFPERTEAERMEDAYAAYGVRPVR